MFEYFDDTLVEGVNAIGILKSVHKYLVERKVCEFIEDRVALSKVLSQINSMMENYYRFPEEDIKNVYVQLGKLILVWLIECYTKLEINNQQ